MSDCGGEDFPATLGKLEQETRLPEQTLLIAIGWLAREDRVTLTPVRNSPQGSLTQG